MRPSAIRGVLLALVGFLGPGLESQADDAAEALVRRGIATMGGEAKLIKATQGMDYKTDGKLTIAGNESNFTSHIRIARGDKFRSEVRVELESGPLVLVTVVDGSRGWRKVNSGTDELEPNGVAFNKRNVYLAVVPITLVALVNPEMGFRYQADGEEKVGGKNAKVLKVTGPDGKTFRLLLDAESGLPLKMTASVAGLGGDEYDQATTFSDYKEMGGILKATKVETTRDGERFINGKITEFHAEDQPAATFAEPK